MPLRGELPAAGLRERKKSKTRAAIQHHALRLFRKKGYEATAVSEIAAAADISESTFFRYFPTKEAVALWDDLDPILVAAFKAQPASLAPIPALRAAFKTTFRQLPAADLDDMHQRVALVMSVPELRAAMLDQVAGAMRLMCEALAERTGRSADDLRVRTLVGAVLGAMVAATFAVADTPAADYGSLIDQALAHLESGLPLGARRIRTG